MIETLLVAGTFVLAGLATILLFIVRGRLRRERRSSKSDLRRRLENRLAETHSEDRTHLERPPAIRELAVVDRTDDGEPIYVPVVRVALGSTEAPSMDLVFEFVASVLEAVHPVLTADGAHVRHYDVQFTFGPNGLLVSRSCRRVSVPSELADRLCRDENYHPFDLQRDVTRGDDGDDETTPAVWAACRS